MRYDTAKKALYYDYFVKDHLGNIRMVLTEQKDTSFYPAASLETTQLPTERAIYSKVDTGRVNKSTVAGYPTDTYKNPNGYIQKTGSNGVKVGTGIVLKVMAGDQFNLRVNSWYSSSSPAPNSPVSPLNDLIAALAGGIGNIPGKSATEIINSGVLTPNATGFLNNQSGYTTSKPKAFINWILLDERFNYVANSSGFEQVGAAGIFTTHVKNNMPLNKSGYLYIYVSNETPNIDVLFDNLQVTHTRGALLEENHFYPFGLTMAGISSKALKSNYAENKKKYNGIEFDNDLDLNEYEAFYRDLDPQTGRWWQIDPKVDAGYESVSPYASMYDDPEKYSDPLGDEGEEANDCCKYLKTAFASVSGAALGFIDNNVPFSNLRGAVANSGIIEDPDVADAWNKASDAADVFGVVQGTAETTTGAAVFDASLTVTASTGGASIEISGPGMLAGGGLSLHGVFVANKSANNLISQNGRVNIESKKQTGSYTNTHDSGKTYSGKGSQDRAKQSGERVAKEHSDPVKKTAWKPSKNNREAFKAEDKRINRNGGAGNTKKNYNKINSPGKKYNKEDN